MSARLVKRFRYHGRVYRTGPRLNLIPSQECGEVRTSIHRLGGGLLSPLIVRRLGAYLGGPV